LEKISEEETDTEDEEREETREELADEEDEEEEDREADGLAFWFCAWFLRNERTEKRRGDDEQWVNKIENRHTCVCFVQRSNHYLDLD
jgi:hypothetical protein